MVWGTDPGPSLFSREVVERTELMLVKFNNMYDTKSFLGFLYHQT
jgi:hypothetical protein